MLEQPAELARVVGTICHQTRITNDAAGKWAFDTATVEVCVHAPRPLDQPQQCPILSASS
eukprot:6324886-Heterocapsa_arctica.AAC.1